MNNIKKAFTLAEVLTTVVVIGVVAILVLPNIIDSSGQKTNEMAAKKAKLDVTQAAMRVQAECPRGHGCTYAKINDIFKETLPNKGDTKFKFKKTDNVVSDIVVDVESDDYVDLHYQIDIAAGTVTDDTDCNVNKYLTNTSCAAEDNGFTTTTTTEKNGKITKTTTKNKFSTLSGYGSL